MLRANHAQQILAFEGELAVDVIYGNHPALDRETATACGLLMKRPQYFNETLTKCLAGS